MTTVFYRNSQHRIFPVKKNSHYHSLDEHSDCHELATTIDEAKKFAKSYVSIYNIIQRYINQDFSNLNQLELQFGSFIIVNGREIKIVPYEIPEFQSYLKHYLLGKSLLDIRDLDLDDYVMLIHANFPNAIIYRKDNDVHFCLTEEEFAMEKFSSDNVSIIKVTRYRLERDQKIFRKYDLFQK